MFGALIEESGSHETHRWRKTDSNPRSRLSRAARSAGSSQSVGRDWRRPGASSYVVAAPSGSLIQPAGIKHAASSSDISTMPSNPTVIWRFEKVYTAPMPAGALTHCVEDRPRRQRNTRVVEVEDVGHTGRIRSEQRHCERHDGFLIVP